MAYIALFIFVNRYYPLIKNDRIPDNNMFRIHVWYWSYMSILPDIVHFSMYLTRHRSLLHVSYQTLFTSACILPDIVHFSMYLTRHYSLQHVSYQTSFTSTCVLPDMVSFKFYLSFTSPLFYQTLFTWDTGCTCTGEKLTTKRGTIIQ